VAPGTRRVFLPTLAQVTPRDLSRLRATAP
jgi:hypothetical protein